MNGRLGRVLAAVAVDAGLLRRRREYRLLVAGQAVSDLGSMITLVAIPVQTFRITGSSVAVGLLRGGLVGVGRGAVAALGLRRAARARANCGWVGRLGAVAAGERQRARTPSLVDLLSQIPRKSTTDARSPSRGGRSRWLNAAVLDPHNGRRA